MEVIRSSYRTMMQRLKMHPDLGGDHQDAALVNEAYAVLMNPKARAEYDANLEKRQNSKQTEAAKEKSESQANETSDTQSHKTYYDIDITMYCPFCKTLHGLGKMVEPQSVCAKCESALFPATKQTFEKSGQRNIQRIDKQWPISFYTHWLDTKPHTGYTHDVSLNGIQIITDTVLEHSQVIKITANTLDALGRVVNQREDASGANEQWRVGLEFVTLRFHHARGTFVKLSV